MIRAVALDRVLDAVKTIVDGDEVNATRLTREALEDLESEVTIEDLQDELMLARHDVEQLEQRIAVLKAKELIQQAEPSR